MTSPAINHAVAEIRKHLAHNANAVLRLSEVPAKFGTTKGGADKAFDLLKCSGEVVSCKVIAAGVEDDEFRLATAKVAAFRTIKPSSSDTRRQDTKHIPSHFGRAQPPVAATPAPVPAAHGVAERPRMPGRQAAILEFINAIDRPSTTREMLAHFELSEPHVTKDAVWSAVRHMVNEGMLAQCGKARFNGFNKATAYATPAIAARLAGPNAQQGRDGESGPALQPMPAEAAPAAAAQPGAAPPEQKTVQQPPKRSLAYRARPEPATIERAPRTLLEVFFRGCDFQWYSLPWLVLCLGGDVPAVLEGLALLVRDGRVEYAETDGRCLWHPIPERWA